MGSLFTNALVGGLKSVLALAGQDISYYDASTDTTYTGVKAILGETDWSAEDYSGMYIARKERDFIVLYDDLPLEPADGDYVTHDGNIFHVLPGKGEPAWRWTDQERQAYRIHTRDKDAAP